MVLPGRTILRFLFCEHHHVSNLFCKLHPLHHPLHSCPCPPNSLSSFFLLCFILSPSLPLISGECSMIILSLLVIWFNCYCTMMNLVIAFFLLSLHHYCIVCVWAAWYGTFRSHGLQYRSYHWLVYHYRIVCVYYSSTRRMVR
jgi:hypothetical protein